MRKLLKQSDGERKRFNAKFSRIGKKRNFKGYSEDTILLTDVKDATTGVLITDHVWFTFTRGFDAANIREGDIIEFDARVKAYRKGWINRSLQINNQKTDFRLSNPTKISVVKKDGSL